MITEIILKKAQIYKSITAKAWINIDNEPKSLQP